MYVLVVAETREPSKERLPGHLNPSALGHVPERERERRAKLGPGTRRPRQGALKLLVIARKNPKALLVA